MRLSAKDRRFDCQPASQLTLNILDNEIKILTATLRKLERETKILVKFPSLYESKGGADIGLN